IRYPCLSSRTLVTARPSCPAMATSRARLAHTGASVWRRPNLVGSAPECKVGDKAASETSQREGAEQRCTSLGEPGVEAIEPDARYWLASASQSSREPPERRS